MQIDRDSIEMGFFTASKQYSLWNRPILMFAIATCTLYIITPRRVCASAVKQSVLSVVFVVVVVCHKKIVISGDLEAITILETRITMKFVVY